MSLLDYSTGDRRLMPIQMARVMAWSTAGGRKTQTRRLLKPQPNMRPDLYIQKMHGTTTDGQPFGDQYLWRRVGPDYPDDECDDIRLPYAVGDLLWVQEEWCHFPDYAPDGMGEAIYYRAVPEDESAAAWRTKEQCGVEWIPAEQMHRDVSRLTLEITDVRVRPLQCISEEDAIAEGIWVAEDCPAYRRYFLPIGPGETLFGGRAVDVFRLLWEHIYGAGAWDQNPWVSALTFIAHKCNVDDFLQRAEASS